MSNKKQIAIVGGGIAGLSAGWELKKAGFDVTVFEANEYAGGRMLSSRDGGYTFDQGADFFSENYRTLEAYAKEFGLSWDKLLTRVNHRVVRDGIAYEYSLRQQSRFAPKLPMLSTRANVALITWLLKLKFARSYGDFFYLSSVSKRHHGENAFDYLSQKIHPEIATYIADSFVSIMQFHRANKISADALMAFMKMLITPKTQFSVRYTSGRIDAIPRAMAKNLNVKYGAAVKSIKSNEGIVKVGLGDKVEEFDGVVVATPAPVAVKIYKNLNAKFKNLLDKTRYAKTFVLSIEAKGDLIPQTYLTFVPFAENKVIAGYTNESVKPGVGKSGKTYFNIYLHEEAAKVLWYKSDVEVESIVLSELAKVFPEINEEGVPVKVVGLKRWDLAMPVFSDSHIKRVAQWEQDNDLPENVAFAGDYLNAPWTEGASRSGQRAAKRLIENL